MASFKKGDKVKITDRIGQVRYGVISAKGMDLAATSGKLSWWYVDLADGTPDTFQEVYISKA